MRSFVIILLSPVGDDPTGFRTRGKEPTIQTPVAEYAIETLVVPVLPWTTGFDEVRLALVHVEPGGDLTGNEFRAVVTFDRDRSTTWCNQLL